MMRLTLILCLSLLLWGLDVVESSSITPKGVGREDFRNPTQDTDAISQELGARLGSAARLYRSGDVLFIDGFEGPLMWTPGGAGASQGGSLVISQAKARTGTSSLLAAPSDAGGEITATRRYAVPTLTENIGVEVSFLMDPDDLPQTVGLNVQLYDGSQQQQYQLVVYTQEADTRKDVITYLTIPNGNQVPLDGTALVSANGMFNTLKVVFDPVDKEYRRALINNTEHNFADVVANFGSIFPNASPVVAANPASALLFASSDRPNLRVALSAGGVQGTPKKVYFDDLVITTNEPDAQ